MSKYLYGASIQGIQSFIFQTNKLREIVGGSELVEEICKDILHGEFDIPYNFKGIIQSAAGNVKIIFSEEESALMNRLILQYPKKAMEKAPGITVSQAVEKFGLGQNFKTVIDNLERKLKTQRNKASKPLEFGFMGVARDRTTGGVGIWMNKETKRRLNLENDVISSSTQAKLEKAFGEYKEDRDGDKIFSSLVTKTIPEDMLGEGNPELTKDLAKFTEGHKNHWIGVVHVDGNGLGKLIQELSETLQKQKKSLDECKNTFRNFSEKLEEATQEAAKEAFKQVFKAWSKEEYYPFRPIVCGGDDLTILIRADKALEYTKFFIENFQNQTATYLSFLRDKFGINTFIEGLTACAGISFVKKSYPLHYALDLSESLTKEAKRMVKNNDQFITSTGLPKSSLAFYKVQESFIDDLQELKKRTLLAKEKLDFFGGPYLLEELESKLIQPLKTIQDEADKRESKSKAVGKLRSIVAGTFENLDAASFSLERMKEVNMAFYHNLYLDDFKAAIESTKSGQTQQSTLFDLISLHSFNYGKHGGN